MVEFLVAKFISSLYWAIHLHSATGIRKCQGKVTELSEQYMNTISPKKFIKTGRLLQYCFQPILAHSRVEWQTANVCFGSKIDARPCNH